MSGLISSFIIEPVVRQARRFSRPSISSADTPRQGSASQISPNGLHNSNEDEISLAAVTRVVSGETRTLDVLNINRDDPLTSAISGEPLVSSPTTEDGGLDAELDALEDTQRNNLSPLSRNLLQSSLSHRELIQPDEETPNPSYGIPERFRSNNNSFTSSLNSLAETPEGSPRRFTGQDSVRSLAGSYNSRMGNGILPEDDGMGWLRKRIVEIREMEVSNLEKAKMMHDLMTEQHNPSQASLHAPHLHGPRSPSSLLSLDNPLTPNPITSPMDTGVDPPTPMSMSSAVDPLNPYNVDERALEPTYAPKAQPDSIDTALSLEGDENGSETDDTPMLGCSHYKRNVKLQCSACSRWYTCRFCHDEVEDHSLNRRATKNMLCMLCGSPQPAAEHCIECGERAAWYYCDICKLWDNDSEKSIYHCNDCGICRIGQGLGKDFYHCKKCCVCMSISIASSHRCIERSTDCDCPICGEYMFTSPQTVVFMRCGHSIHHKCYYDHMKTSYRCPICSRSIVNMEMQFRNLDRAIESQPMPAHFRDTKALVYCNDCAAKTSVDYHWLGLKCAVCDSYNTAQIQILSGPDPQALPTPNAEDTAEPSELTDPAVSSTGTQSPLRGRQSRGVPSTYLQPLDSSQHRPTSSASATDNMRFSPYLVLPRVGRSVSPLRNFGDDLNSTNTAAIEEVELMDSDAEDEDEDVGFWGGEGTRSPSTSTARVGEVQDDPDDEDESMDEDDEDMEDDEMDDDDTDINDQLELLGHR